MVGCEEFGVGWVEEAALVVRESVRAVVKGREGNRGDSFRTAGGSTFSAVSLHHLVCQFNSQRRSKLGFFPQGSTSNYGLSASPHDEMIEIPDTFPYSV